MILVIDDKEDILTCAMFYEGVLVAENLEKAAEIMRTNKISRVYTDYHGVERNGFKVRDLMTSCLISKIPLALTSGDPSIAEDFKRAGCRTISKIECLEEIRSMTSPHK